MRKIHEQIVSVSYGKDALDNLFARFTTEGHIKNYNNPCPNRSSWLQLDKQGAVQIKLIVMETAKEEYDIIDTESDDDYLGFKPGLRLATTEELLALGICFTPALCPVLAVDPWRHEEDFFLLLKTNGHLEIIERIWDPYHVLFADDPVHHHQLQF